VWVHLQRAPGKYYGVKSGVAYKGWQGLSQKEEGYALVGKRYSSPGNEGLPFWEGATLGLGRHWDLSQVKLVVTGQLGPTRDWRIFLERCVSGPDSVGVARWCRWTVGPASGQGGGPATEGWGGLQGNRILRE
jgi:hypothetical protein